VKFVAVILAMFPLAACSTVRDDIVDVGAYSNFGLWNCSHQQLHSHPLGREGEALVQTDQLHLERRLRVFEWLAPIEGADKLREADERQDFEARQLMIMGDIDERAMHRRIDRCLSELERRQANSEG